MLLLQMEGAARVPPLLLCLLLEAVEEHLICLQCIPVCVTGFGQYLANVYRMRQRGRDISVPCLLRYDQS